MKKSEEKELQILSQKKRLTFGELQREKLLWDKYHNERDKYSNIK